VARGGLGRGHGSMFNETVEESGSDSVVSELPISRIDRNPAQPRASFDEESIKELAASIKRDGLLQPIIVRPNGDKYQIIAGERRWQACKSLGMEKIPVRIMHVDEVKTLELALIENLQRTNLNPIEEARGFKDLAAASGMKQQEIAEAVSKSRATVANSMRLLELPEEVQELIFEGKLSAGHGKAILAVGDDDRRIALAKRIVEERLSVREAEAMARLFDAAGMERTKRKATPRAFKTVARKLRQQLDTNVKVKTVRGKNKIEIEFKDAEDLERIFKSLSGSFIPEEEDEYAEE